MVDAVQGTPDITVDEYNQIVGAVRGDPELAARIDKLMAERRAISGQVCLAADTNHFLFVLSQDPPTRRKEMKLTAAQLRKVEEQLGIEAVSEEHPNSTRLKEAFGDHTFFLDARGLNIVEPNPSPESSSGNLVKLASWNDDRTSLLVHEPQVLSVIVLADKRTLH